MLFCSCCFQLESSGVKIRNIILLTWVVRAATTFCKPKMITGSLIRGTVNTQLSVYLIHLFMTVSCPYYSLLNWTFVLQLSLVDSTHNTPLIAGLPRVKGFLEERVCFQGCVLVLTACNSDVVEWQSDYKVTEQWSPETKTPEGFKLPASILSFFSFQT
jgi:hypothetical protein